MSSSSISGLSDTPRTQNSSGGLRNSGCEILLEAECNEVSSWQRSLGFYFIVVVGVVFSVFVFVFLGLYTYSCSRASSDSVGMGVELTFRNDIGMRKFTCSASCYCNEDEIEPRRTSSTLLRSIYYTTAAASLALALKYSSMYFQEECSNKYFSLCDRGEISHEIEFCEDRGDEMDVLMFDTGDELTGWEKIWAEEEYKKEGIKKYDRVLEEYKDYEEEYECDGYCLRRMFKRPEPQKAAEEFDCRKKRIKRIFRVGIPKTAGKYFQKWDTKLKKLVHTYDEGSIRLNTAAVNKFLSEHLTIYCKSVSVFEYEYIFLRKGIKGKTKMRKSASVSLCAGRSGSLKENITCRKIREINS